MSLVGRRIIQSYVPSLEDKAFDSPAFSLKTDLNFCIRSNPARRSCNTCGPTVHPFVL